MCKPLLDLIRLAVLGLFGALLLPDSPGARADQFDLEMGNPTRWRASSPAGIWNDATQTLTWHFNPLDFPQPNWPTVAQAGAAFENGYRTLQDVAGTSLKIVRGADATTPPQINDQRLDMCFAKDGLDPFTGADISAYFAVTYVRSDGTGNLTDADVVMNGNAIPGPFSATFDWATTFPPPNGTNDVEVTACHEQIHSIGGGHPVFFYSMVWPTGRTPELTLPDRCLSPDDRVLIRTLYPAAPALRTISGTVSGNCNLAVVVATNGSGIPIATRVTDSTGAYSLNVPAGAGYTVTAHHYSYTDYVPSDINFGTATDFISASVSAPVDVTGGNATNVNITSTAGIPSMQLTGLRRVGGGQLGTQVLFLNKGTSGTIELEITTASPFAAVTGNTASLGPDITVGAVTAVAGQGFSTVTIPYTVDAAATAGLRNLSFSITGVVPGTPERFFVPAYIEVVDTTSTLTVAASAGNPPGGAAALGLADVPLLGFTLTANAVEDIRIRRLRFALNGSGSQMPKSKLWFDNGTLGAKDGPDVQIFSGAAYSTPGVINEVIPAGPNGTVTFDNLAVTIPAGQSVNFLFTGDMPATGNSSYTVDLIGSGANIDATGMFWGNNIAATGTAAGNQHDAGSLAVANLKQLRTTGLTAIPLGGSTNETQVTIQGVVTSSFAGTVGLEVEVKPLGAAFANSGVSVTGQASGTTINVNVTGLANFTSYHWQARPTHETQAPGDWVQFDGTNTENEADFSSDNSTTNVPTVLQQFEKDGTTVVPVGGPVKGRVVFSATNGTNSGAQQVRLEVEVQPVGTAFTNTPNVFSGFVASGTAATAAWSQGRSGTYHWQARSANTFGTTSAWVNFNAAAIHFDFTKSSGGGGGGGCIGTVAGGGGGFWWALAALGLIAVFARGRSM